MQLTKRNDGYHTQDQQCFATLGEASAHVRRLAIAFYLRTIRDMLLGNTGRLSPTEKKAVSRRTKRSGMFSREELDTLGDWTDAIKDILEEEVVIIDESTRALRPRMAPPLAQAA